jgi:hypothetical protein
MSLELKIEALTAAIIALTAKLESSNVASAAPVAPAPVVQVAPAPVVAAPVAPVAVPAMPDAPFWPKTEAVVAAQTAGAPFSDGKGLIDYVMASYKALGAAKGSQIQNVLTGLGYQNINDVKPEHYAQLFAGVEALK